MTTKEMEFIQDVKPVNQNTLLFNRDSIEDTDMDVAGIAWLKTNISNQSGLKISFKPTIIVDNNYYGLQKYPQGFAFILTSNPTNRIIGEKRSGLGFEGIYNSIAFFFDFITNPDKMDANFPHFSITHNLNGQIKSICSDANLCNKVIPNFYDNEIDQFISNMKISIELYNGNFRVLFNDEETIKGSLPEFAYIMDNESVFFGVSSSMTLYKGVKIEDLKLMTSKNIGLILNFNYLNLNQFE